MNEINKSIYFTLAELADLFEVDVRTVQNYANEGMPRELRGKYNLFDCVQWRLNYLKQKIEEAQRGDETLYKLRQDEQQLKNEMRRVQLNKLQNSVIDAETVRAVWIRQIKVIVSNIEAAAPRINNQIAGDAKTLKIIRDEINAIRKIISETKLDFNLNEEEENEIDQIIDQE